MYIVLAVTVLSHTQSWNIVHYSLFFCTYFSGARKYCLNFYGGYYISSTIYLVFEIRILC